MLNKNKLRDLITAAQLQLGLSAAVIEKDFYVTQIIHSLAGIENEYFQLIFAGGTCLAKAHRLVKRMSEDIDFKVVFKSKEAFSKTRLLKMLKEFRTQITESIVFPGVTMTNSAVRNEGKYMRIDLTYPTLFDSNEVLRPHLLLEFTLSETRLPTKELGIKSIIEDTITIDPISPSSPINCISVNETAIEKWVSLTRRISAIHKKYDADDATLIRHLYDLNAIQQAAVLDNSFFDLANVIVEQDGKQFRNQHPEYASEPINEILNSINLLKTQTIWKSRYQNFIDAMVYDRNYVPDFDTSIASIETISHEVIQEIRSTSTNNPRH
jgi:predicted nucleotidyltransferase component of viral defense system